MPSEKPFHRRCSSKCNYPLQSSRVKRKFEKSKRACFSIRDFRVVGVYNCRKRDALLRRRRNRFIGDALLNVITLFNQGNGDIADGQVHCHPTKMLSSQALRILTDDPVCAARRHRRLCVRAPHNVRKTPKVFKKTNLMSLVSHPGIF